jgi:hypothetical protein
MSEDRDKLSETDELETEDNDVEAHVLGDDEKSVLGDDEKGVLGDDERGRIDDNG